MAGCGDEQGASTAVTVLVQASSRPPSVEYRVACTNDGTEPRFSTTLDDSLEDAGLLDLGAAQGLASVWNAVVQMGSGKCAILLLVLDDGGEAFCVANEALPAVADLPESLFFELDCPIGRINTGPPPGTLVLTAETLAEPTLPAVADVTYALTCRWTTLDSVFEILLEGSLDLVGQDGALNDGELVLTNEWALRFEDTGAGPCQLELVAVDAEGAPVCSFEEELEVISDTTTTVRATLFCHETASVERDAFREACGRISTEQCDAGDGCFVRSAGRIDAEGICLQTEPIACMWEGDCGDQSIVQVMSPEGVIYVSFQDCAPLGWTVLRDKGSVEHPDAFQWPECEPNEELREVDSQLPGLTRRTNDRLSHSRDSGP